MAWPGRFDCQGRGYHSTYLGAYVLWDGCGAVARRGTTWVARRWKRLKEPAGKYEKGRQQIDATGLRLIDGHQTCPVREDTNGEKSTQTFSFYLLSSWVIMSPPDTISLPLLPTKERFPFQSMVVVVLAARDKAVGARLPIRVGVVY